MSIRDMRENANNADDELRDLVDAAHAQGMYVILDIVLNHTGDVFAYVCDPGETNCTGNQWRAGGFSEFARPVHWRDENAVAQSAWTDIAALPNMSTDPMVWPKELAEERVLSQAGDARSERQTIRSGISTR